MTDRITTRIARLGAPAALLGGIALHAATGATAPVFNAQRTPPASPAASPGASPLASPGASPAASPVAQLDDAGIPARIDAMLAGEDGVYGVLIAREDGTILYARDSELPFMTASLYKLIVMADIYRKIELHELDQQQPIVLDGAMFSDDGEAYFTEDMIGTSYPLQEYLFAAGAYSSNVAAWTLLALTSIEELAQTVQDIGLHRTTIMQPLTTVAWWPPRPGHDASVADTNLATAFVESWGLDNELTSITTPRDMARYMQALITKTLISPWISEQIIAILMQQTVRDRIPALLPVNTPSLNKTGNLVSVINDVGVIVLPQERGPRIVALLSEAMADDLRATLILQRLALMATGATAIPPLDVPNPAGLNVIDTLDTTWSSDDATATTLDPTEESMPADGSDGTDGSDDADTSDGT